MGDPNSFSAPNSATLDNFITFFNSAITGGNPIAIKVGNLVGLFSPDSGGPPPNHPGVGIAHHGPNFKGRAEIGKLFTQLFTSFPDLTLTELDRGRRLYSLDSYGGLDTIGTQTNLAGTYQSPWFPKTKDPDSTSHYSKPLSDIPVVQGANPNYRALQGNGIPAFAMFALDGNSAIYQLQVYLDRYRFRSDLEPPVS